MNDIAGFLKTMDTSVRRAGAELLEQHAGLSTARSKGGVDVVTAADGHAEELLVAALRAQLPEHGIIAEEGSRQQGEGWCWHVDPLDGTANYSRGLPDWAISLGLSFEGVPVGGIVYAPQLDLHWLGGRGMGVCCNGRSCAPAGTAQEPRTWLLASDNPWDPQARRRNLQVVADIACGIRMPLMRGSAAVALGLLCSGSVDAYLLAKAFSWDYCAGAAMAAELGYSVLDWQGQGWRIGAETMLACRPGMERRLQAAIAVVTPPDA